MNRRYLTPIVVLVLSLAAITYAAQQLTINNTGTVPSTGTNLMFSPVVATQPNCASVIYGETLQDINWGTLAFGDNVRYFCLKNMENAPHTIVVSGTPTAGTGTVVPAVNPLGSLQTTLVTMTWTITTTTPAGTATWTVTLA